MTTCRSSIIALVLAGATLAPAMAFAQRPTPRPRPVPPRPRISTEPGAATRTSGPTVFTTRRPETIGRLVLRTAPVAPRQTLAAATGVSAGEYVAAPFVDVDGGPSRPGRIVGTSHVTSIPLTMSDRRLQLRERIFVLPPGGRADPGARYVAFAQGPLLEGVGQVVIPTGVVRIERALPGQAAEATIVALYGEMFLDQGLMPLTLPAASTAAATPIANGARSRVLWIPDRAVLPSLQDYLIVENTVAGGLRPGDQITLLRERSRMEDGVVIPETHIAVAEIVRVTSRASTAMIIHQSHPAIEEGTVARVTAKMP